METDKDTRKLERVPNTKCQCGTDRSVKKLQCFRTFKLFIKHILQFLYAVPIRKGI